MALKIISYIFIVSLVFGFPAAAQIKDVPFDVNEVINQASPHHSLTPNPKSITADFLTGEFLIDVNMNYIAAMDAQETPAVAFDGTNHLVVWADERSGNPGIYGARVSRTGVVLDPAGILIGASGYSPSVAFNDQNYLVVWTTFRNGDGNIYGARVSQTGVVLDPDGIIITDADQDQEFPSVAFDGQNNLVVWQDEDEIYGTRISPEGVILDTVRILISEDGENPSVGFDGQNYIVVWENWGWECDIYGARVSRAGIVLDPAGFAITTAEDDQKSPAVTFGDQNYLVVWQDNRWNWFYHDIYGARVSRDGVVLDTLGIAVTTVEAQNEFPAVTFDGENYLVIWQDERNVVYDIYCARISTAGTVIDTTGIAISTADHDQCSPAVAFDGQHYLVVWQDWRNGHGNIYGNRISRYGVGSPNEIAISTVVYWQFSPTVAFDGQNYLVVWQDYRRGEYDIWGARISQAGDILDTIGIVVSAAINDQCNPSIAFDGTNYLVVWEHNSDIYGARISQSGNLLDTNGIAIATFWERQSLPAVAFDGQNYLVVWGDRSSGSYDIFGARVSPDGVVLDPIGLLFSTGYCESPAVAFGGQNFLVVWQDLRNNDEWDIYGTRVSRDGVVLDPNGIAISTAEYKQRFSSIAFDGTNYLVVWEDWRHYPFDIYSTRVSQDGIILDTNGIAISTAASWQTNPDVIFDGQNYFLMWEDYRSGYSWDIYGARMNYSGIVVDSFPGSTQAGNQLSPVLARGAGNRVLITYSGWTGMYQGRNYNTMRIWGKFYPFINIEEENPKVKIQTAKLLEVYPNPAKGVVRVRGPLNEKTIKIFDICGKMIKEIATTASQSRNDGAVVISLKGINPGIYFLQFENEIRKFLVVR